MACSCGGKTEENGNSKFTDTVDSWFDFDESGQVDFQDLKTRKAFFWIAVLTLIVSTISLLRSG